MPSRHGAADPQADAEERSQATVVIAQRIKQGREGDVRHWQEDVNRAVAEFAGYLGNDVAPSADDDEWTVVYRFDSKPHLESWLTSKQRSELIGRGAGLFDGPASQNVLVGKDESDLVTVVVSHPVNPSDEDAFLAWHERVADAERGFAGFRGAELFPPVTGIQEEWTALYRFDSDEHLDAWLESAERQRLLDEGKRFKNFSLKRISAPFGSWFASAGGEGGGEAPAQWKTALSVLVGLYPTVVLLTLAISELWKKAELWESLLIGNILSVALLTWVVMPVVTRALRFWLEPEGGHADVRLNASGTVACVAFLTFAAFVFWLCTTQIWHLP
jgi:antibiotic biosynthesis monooxygenase (ABM) superfamily enzyme